MSHTHTFLSNGLTYLAILAGLVLALLAYLLLAREQRLARPRLVTIQAVYALMALACVLVVTGFASEYNNLDFESLQTEAAATTNALSEQRARTENLEVKLQRVREVAQTLDAKTKDLAATDTTDCAEPAQPVRQQLLALGERLDAVVNR